MTEREKIIEIIKKNGTYNGKSLSFDYYVVRPDDIADALIENGIRDINSKGVVAVEDEVSLVPENIIADVKFALDGNVAEWKRRTEVAEKELERYKRALRGACGIGAAIRTEEHIKARMDCFLRQADREIEEEREND